MNNSHDVIVVGAGIFGATAALELQRRGHQAVVLDPGPLPHPLASSTDISKVIRIEYADDETYARLADECRITWLEWNTAFGETLYHDVGVVMVTRKPMAPGEYEYENYHSLLRRGYHADRLDSQLIAERFPAFSPELYVDGYYHAEAGYAESGRVVMALLAQAEQAGATVLPGNIVTDVLIDSGRVQGVKTAAGESYAAGAVVVAAGVWTPYLLPELQSFITVQGMPVFHLKPDNPTLFEPPKLAVFSADVSQSGWYGFPLHPTEKVIKIAFHGIGMPTHPVEDERVVTDYETQQLRAFLADAMPPLLEAPIVHTRRCLYCDTLDEHFWIDRHPEVDGLVVAAGGSGHAFKFGPLLGPWIADALVGSTRPELEKFRWRELPLDTEGEEASRYRGSI